MKKYLFSFLVITFSFNASAALISSGDFVTDTTQGLDWLRQDVVTNFNLSYADTLTANPEWRLATNAEVEILFQQAFPNFQSNVPTYGNAIKGVQYPQFENPYSDLVDDVYNFAGLFGKARQLTETNPNQPHQGDYWYTFSIYKDENNLWTRIGVSADERNGIEMWYIIGLDEGSNESNYANIGSPFGGFMLVRTTAVPIPAALWLFGSGLGLLGWMRRKPA